MPKANSNTRPVERNKSFLDSIKGDGTKKEKFKGVSVTKNGERFYAYIKIDGQFQRLGMFDTPEEAARAFDRAAIQAGRPTSKLNFLDQVPKNYKQNKKLSCGNTTGFTGVYKHGDRFQANIRIGGTQQYIGTFDTAEEAAIAYDHAAIFYEQPTSSLNFPNSNYEIEKIKKEMDLIFTTRREKKEHIARLKKNDPLRACIDACYIALKDERVDPEMVRLSNFFFLINYY